MIQKLHVPVSVVSVFDHKTRNVLPKKVLFEGREHEIIRVGYHHTYRNGRTLLHVFSVASDRMFFRLVHDTETLAWTLEEIDDGEVT
jgi:hypothetical protein